MVHATDDEHKKTITIEYFHDVTLGYDDLVKMAEMHGTNLLEDLQEDLAGKPFPKFRVEIEVTIPGIYNLDKCEKKLLDNFISIFIPIKIKSRKL